MTTIQSIFKTLSKEPLTLASDALGSDEPEALLISAVKTNELVSRFQPCSLEQKSKSQHDKLKDIFGEKDLNTLSEKVGSCLKKSIENFLEKLSKKEVFNEGSGIEIESPSFWREVLKECQKTVCFCTHTHIVDIAKTCCKELFETFVFYKLWCSSFSRRDSLNGQKRSIILDANYMEYFFYAIKFVDIKQFFNCLTQGKSTSELCQIFQCGPEKIEIIMESAFPSYCASFSSEKALRSRDSLVKKIFTVFENESLTVNNIRSGFNGEEIALMRYCSVTDIALINLWKKRENSEESFLFNYIFYPL